MLHLADIGLSPMAYAALTLIPKIGSCVTPAFWGWVFTWRIRLSLILAPMALVIGQGLVAVGLLALERKTPYVAAPTLVLGMVFSSFSKAGISVLQHSCLALLLPTGSGSPKQQRNGGAKSAQRWCDGGHLVTGICLTIGCTHVIGAAVLYLVPKITAR